ncbi:MAG: hypothetical protein N2C14_01965 [Planctomycetales bacterium]
MWRFSLPSAALLAVGFSAAQAQDDAAAQPKKVTFRFQSWPAGMYHPDFPTFCRTCYGGGHCGTPDVCGGKYCGSECATHAPGIETCRKCGPLGRAFCYECRRLGCGQKGGQGCNPMAPCCAKDSLLGLHGKKDCCSTGCGECGGSCGDECCSEYPLLNKLRNWRNRPMGGWAALTGPYQYRLHCFGWREGPLTYYGHCAGSYETRLSGHFDDRGPLNQGSGNHHGEQILGTVDAAAGDNPPTPPALDEGQDLSPEAPLAPMEEGGLDAPPEPDAVPNAPGLRIPTFSRRR